MSSDGKPTRTVNRTARIATSVMAAPTRRTSSIWWASKCMGRLGSRRGAWPASYRRYGERVLSRFAVASRANVPPFYVMDLLAAANRRAAEHGDLLNLVAGQPSTPAPHAIRRAAADALEADLL